MRLTIAEVAQATGMTRAAVRRYLITLAHLGYMRHEDKVFSLTPAVLQLGQSYLQSARLPRIVQPSLYRLAYALGEPSRRAYWTMTNWCAWRLSAPCN